jgi:putative transcriptional regulator
MVQKSKKRPFSKLKGLRAERGLTQLDMAKKLGISETSYVLRETGKREFKLSEMGIISTYFGLSIEDIFFPAKVSKTTQVR